MYKIKADTLAVTPAGVRVGLRVELGEGAPVRFSEVRIPWDLWTNPDRADIIAAFNRSVDLEPEDVPLF